MKRCPQCNLDYFDNMLEFCLEDGARLSVVTDPQAEMQTVARPKHAAKLTAEETVSFNVPNLTEKAPGANNLNQFNKQNDLQEPPKTETLTQKASSQGVKILETAPIILSLAHNWWQWIYLNNQYYSSITGFLVSPNFLMWLLLLTAGGVTGLLALRHGRSKGFAYTSLVILAINLLLFLVPKR